MCEIRLGHLRFSAITRQLRRSWNRLVWGDSDITAVSEPGLIGLLLLAAIGRIVVRRSVDQKVGTQAA